MSMTLLMLLPAGSNSMVSMVSNSSDLEGDIAVDFNGDFGNGVKF